MAAGDDHSLALKNDGTLVAWGGNLDLYGQTVGQGTVPAGLSGITAIACGPDHNLVLKSDGTLVAWGSNYRGENTVPPGLSGVTFIATGGTTNFALIGSLEGSVSGYAQWITMVFDANQQGDLTTSGVKADPDGDGLPNAVEYALGSHPLVRDPPPTAAMVSQSGAIRGSIGFTRKGEIPQGVSLVVEESTDMLDWEDLATKTGTAPWTGTATVEETPGAGGIIQVKVISPASITTLPARRFLRLQAFAP